MKDKITPISAEEVGEPESHIMQSRLTKGCEGVKPASVRIQELEKELADCERERDGAIDLLNTVMYCLEERRLTELLESKSDIDAFLSTLEKNNA